MVRRVGFVLGIAEGSVCDLRHSGSHEVINVEGDGTIGYSFVSVRNGRLKQGSAGIIVRNDDTNT